jgi:integrase
MSHTHIHVNLTKAHIRSAKAPATGYVIHWDTEVKCLGVRVHSTNKRSWFLSYRVAGNQRTPNLGDWPEMTVKEARSLAGEIKREGRKGIDRFAPPAPVKAMSTLADVWEDYRAYAKGKKKNTIATLGSKDSVYKNWLKPRWGNKSLTEVGYTEIEKLHMEMGETSHAQANKMVALMSHLMKWAIKNGHRPAPNPVTDIEKFKIEKRRRRLDKDEAERLWSALDVIEYEQRIPINATKLVRALFISGRRKNEMQKLLRADIKDVVVEQDGTKTGWLSSSITEGLKDILESIPEVEQNPYVFTSDRKPGVAIDINHKQWKAILAEAKIVGFTIHDLRRSYASFALNSGVPLHVVGQLLGHKSLQTTLGYAYLDDTVKAEAAEKASVVILDIVRRKKRAA